MFARCSEAVACAGACLPPCVNRAAACLATRTLDPPAAKIPRETGRSPHRSAVERNETSPTPADTPTPARGKKKGRLAVPTPESPPSGPSPIVRSAQPRVAAPSKRKRCHAPHLLLGGVRDPALCRRRQPGPVEGDRSHTPVAGNFTWAAYPCRHGAGGRRRCCCACAAPVRRSRLLATVVRSRRGAGPAR